MRALWTAWRAYVRSWTRSSRSDDSFKKSRLDAFSRVVDRIAPPMTPADISNLARQLVSCEAAGIIAHASLDRVEHDLDRLEQSSLYRDRDGISDYLRLREALRIERARLRGRA